MERPTVLVCDDDTAFRTVVGMELRARGFQVSLCADAAGCAAFLESTPTDLLLLDLRLPDGDGMDVLRTLVARPQRPEVVILTGHGSLDHAIEAVRLGAADYAAKPCSVDEIELRLKKAIERRDLRARATLLETGLRLPQGGPQYVGRSAAHQHAMHLVERFAPTSAAVLITGETGTGKDVVARLVHARSPRASKPFVVVDCASLHEQLLQSELFGHERGAFTGAASAKPGLFEVADGGTLFLDEIGDTSLSVQVKLLRVLESGAFRRLGGTKELHADVRVLAATNRDLGALIAKGQFRDDLFYRLGAVRIELQPLRTRREDVDVLVEHFLQRVAQRTGGQRSIAPDAMTALHNHDWPGNARELLHALEQALLVAPGHVVERADLAGAVRFGGIGARATDDRDEVPPLHVSERRHIERALGVTGGHRAKAAKLLGISERSLYRKLAGEG